MDANEQEGDIKLQKESADLIAELNRSLPTFLWKFDDAGGRRLRSRVRVWESFRLDASILDQFQELPQLLDPHLPSYIPMLAEAYLESLQRRGSMKHLALRSHLLEPLQGAISRLLYSFCKIRGEKVIVRFLNAETKYLELLLSALEESEIIQGDRSVHFSKRWTWQERYVTLLWLSHLLFAPFDLASISSVDLDEASTPDIAGFRWPPNLPGITLRMLPIAIKYLAAPGKERDAAKALLVRISMRRDMQDLGLLDALIQWSLWALRPTEEPPKESPYYYIGILSYLAGVLRSSMDTPDMDKYLISIFNATHAVTNGGNPTFDSINGSSLARKMMIKVMRSAAVLVLRQQPPTMEGTELVETCIESFLENLADNDTPVRFSSSKALSLVTLRLDPDMAAQVVEAVLESLNRRVLWIKDPQNSDANPIRDISSVDNLEWHGLMLTLSHLLYRRSPPIDQLSDIIHALLLGLSFEQRSTSGVSVGSNVRDAACFGIWALARRYTTQELQGVPTESIFAAKSHPKGSSILQVLATELVVTASRDPAGNIRRGASAALQELIGRHPDTVEKGIWVVQTVDYHAVALRSRAIHEVSLNATKLSSQYGEAFLDALLGWRGVGDVDAAARRLTGTSFGTLTLELAMLDLQPEIALKRFNDSIQLVLNQLKRLESRQAEERHGLLLSLAAILDKFPDLMRLLSEDPEKDLPSRDEVLPAIQDKIDTIVQILEGLKGSTFRRQDLVAEAASRFVVSSVPIFQAAILDPDDWTAAALTRLCAGRHLMSTDNTDELSRAVSIFDRVRIADGEARALLSVLGDILPSWLDRDSEDGETTAAVSEAALVYLTLSSPDNRESTISTWSNMMRSKPTSRSKHGSCYFTALTMAYPLVKHLDGEGADTICNSLLQRWASDKDIESRVAILQAITRSDMLRRKPLIFLDMLAEGLDDYTTTARGDVGSHVRLGALRAIKVLWKSVATAAEPDHEWIQESVSKLFLRVLRLAAEKLDRVRNEAHMTLILTLQSKFGDRLKKFSYSSQRYFGALLRMLSLDCLAESVSDKIKANQVAWISELLAGYVTSADTGNEELVIASRASLGAFCDADGENLDLVCKGLLENLRSRQGQDRVLVSTLEIVSFLLNVGLLQRSAEVDARSLCLLVQKSCYKTGNVRKIDACARVYGGIAALASLDDEAVATKRREEGVVEAKKRLGALMFHPWPKVRSFVVDVVWNVIEGDKEMEGKLNGIDWGKAGSTHVKQTVSELGLE